MNILIVDDDVSGDVFLARAIARMLEALGHRCQAASSVDAALRALAADRPDFLLTDYDLGDSCTGVDLASWTRNAYDLPVVVMTGHDGKIVRAELDDAGLTGVPILAKPFSLDELDRRLAANDNGRPPVKRATNNGAETAVLRAESAQRFARRTALVALAALKVIRGRSV